MGNIVLVPYRGIYFLYFTCDMTDAEFAAGSRPLSGNLFSLRSWGYVLEAPGGKVLVPYRGIYFLYKFNSLYFGFHHNRSRPLSGNLFSLLAEIPLTSTGYGSRPLSGNLFSLPKAYDYGYQTVIMFSSPIGESIFSTSIMFKLVIICDGSSRPLSGNLFSLRGKKKWLEQKLKNGSRPLSGNLFSLPNGNGCVHVLHMVLVPYRGIYFLYDNTSNGENKVLDKVLVPYRGIYFLYGIVHL